MPLPTQRDKTDELSEVCERMQHEIPPATGMMRGMRVFGTLLGLAVMIFSVVAAVLLGFKLYEWLQHPAALDTVVIQWEQLVRGKVDTYMPHIEQAMTNAGGDAKPGPDVVQQVAGIFVIASRPIAIVLMLSLVWILAHLLISLFSTSAHVVSTLSAGEASTLRRILSEFLKRRND